MPKIGGPPIQSRSFIVIPARLSSTRLPKKMLLRDTGKTLVQHTYEAASRATLPGGVCVATDSDEIATEVAKFGGLYELTDPAAPSGTDRVAEVARRHPEIEVFVNVQGDEPEIEGSAIDQVVQILARDRDVAVSTLATPIRTREALDDPACVKVVFNARGRALYFSRSPIPHPRQWSPELLEAEPPLFWQHVGLYAYRRDFLLKLAALPVSPLENVERLEQLRVLHAGYPIAVAPIKHAARGIDTPQDYAAFVARCQNG